LTAALILIKQKELAAIMRYAKRNSGKFFAANVRHISFADLMEGTIMDIAV